MVALVATASVGLAAAPWQAALKVGALLTAAVAVAAYETLVVEVAAADASPQLGS